MAGMMIKKHSRAIFCSLALVLTLLILTPQLPADEGMWPLSELPRLNLKEKGLRMDPPDGPGLDL